MRQVHVLSAIALLELSGCYCAHLPDRFTFGDPDAGVDASQVDAGTVSDSGVDATDSSVDAGDLADSGTDAGRCMLETCNGEDDDCDGIVDEAVVCTLPNATSTCGGSGACEVTACSTGYEDCTSAPGCETDPETDAAHCGACGDPCLTGQTCHAGACRYPRVLAAYAVEGNNATLRSIATDATGALIVAGGAAAGLLRLGGQELTMVAARPGLVARLNTSGVASRVDTLPISPAEMAASVAGVVYVGGSFTGTVSFAGSHTSRSGSFDACVLSLNPDGSEGGFADFGTSADDVLRGMSLRAGSLHVGGYTDGVLPFRTGFGGTDIFLGRVTTGSPHSFSGGQQWGSSGTDRVDSVAGFADGGLVFTGLYTGGEADLGGAEPLPAPSRLSRFVVARYTSEGELTWAVTVDEAFIDNSFPSTVTVDDAGNVYLAATLGRLLGATSEYGLIASLDPTGALRWATSVAINVHQLTVGSDGDLYVAGSVFVRGDAFIAGDPFPVGGDRDMIVARLGAATGSVVWARALGGAGGDRAEGVLPLADGSVWVVGSFSGVVAFDSTILTEAGAGAVNGFLAHIAP